MARHTWHTLKCDNFKLSLPWHTWHTRGFKFANFTKKTWLDILGILRTLEFAHFDENIARHT